MESIALLTNILRKTVVAHPNIKPSRAQLNTIFRQYQDQRIPRMKKIMEFSNMITRVQAWDGPLMKFVAIGVLPYQKGTKLGEDIGAIISVSVKLDFAPIVSPAGRIPWDGDGNDNGAVNPTRHG
jgi:hypothetical protein